MQEKEIFLSLDILAKLGASKKLLEFFKENYPNDSATLSEVIIKLQELANTDTDTDTGYVGCAIWLFDTFPPTQEPLVLSELNRKIIIHNGNLTIKVNIAGDRIIIVNGDLNTEDGVNLNGYGYICAKNVIAKDKTIALDVEAQIVAETLDAQNIILNLLAKIWAKKDVNAINIVLYGFAEIWARGKVEAPNIVTNDTSRIYGKVNSMS